MYQEVKIGDKVVPMLAMSSVDYIYEQIFHEDPIKLQGSDDFESNFGVQLVFLQKMGFVMAKFAELHERKETCKLTIDNYLDWIDQFTRAEYITALVDVKRVYEGQSVTQSEAKKNNELPTDL